MSESHKNGQSHFDPKLKEIKRDNILQKEIKNILVSVIYIFAL